MFRKILRLDCDGVRGKKSMHIMFVFYTGKVESQKNCNLPALSAGSKCTDCQYVLYPDEYPFYDADLRRLQGSNTDLMLRFCTVVVVIMAFIILFYVNSFVIRQRKKEIGLYCVLGMEKRHLSVMMLWEVVLTSWGNLGESFQAPCSASLRFVFLALLIPSDLVV